MKSNYSDTISERIQYDAVGGATSKPKIKTEYYDGSTWQVFSDVESRSIELSNDNRRYQSYSFMPPVKTINFTLNNFEQIYSTGSGDAKASILTKNLLVRAWSGYELTMADTTGTGDDFSTDAKLVHVQKSGSKLYADIDSYTGTIASGSDLVLYGTTTYGATAYSPLGYYHKAVTITNIEREFLEVTVNASSNNFDFAYRVSPNADFMGSAWSTFSNISTGANVKDIFADDQDNYMEYMVRFKAPTWTTATDYINSIRYVKEDKVYLFKRGTFVLDEPRYSDKVQCIGRDYLKKALETEVNLPTLSSVNIGTAISYVLDRCSVPYDVSNWNTTGTTVSVNSTLAENINNISGWQCLDYLMDCLNAGDDDWRLKTEEDGSLSLKIIPTDVEADWTVHYHYNIESIQKNFDSDKQLQRVTVMNKDFVVNPESTLKHLTGTTTSTSLYSTLPKALFIRFSDTLGVITEESSRTNTAITFGVNSGDEYNIYIYGCTPKNALTDEVYAERGNSSNIINNDGSTYKRINPFMSEDMCTAYADYLIGFYEDPPYKIDLTMNSNPYLELNDNVMVFDIYTYTDNIYGLTSIKESWSEPGMKDSLLFQSRGFSLGRFIWDRNGLNSGINDLPYDKGFVWDQDLTIGSSDTATYTKQIAMS